MVNPYIERMNWENDSRVQAGQREDWFSSFNEEQMTAVVAFTDEESEPDWLISLYEEKRLLSLVDKLSDEQLARLGEINGKADEWEPDEVEAFSIFGV